MIKSLLIFLVSVTIPIYNEYHSSDFDIIIQNIRLFDGENVYPNATILVSKGKISKIILDKKTQFEGGNVIDGENKTLIPGLINAHTHAETPKKLKEAASAGVLTLLNLFSPNPHYTDSLRMYRDSINYAYYYSSGPGLTVPGGHGTQRNTNLYTVTNSSQIDVFIKSRISEKSDYIKLILEHGKNSNLPTLNDSMLIEAFKLTNKKKLISVTHISKRSDALKVLNYGGSGLAHLSWRDSIPISQDELNMFKKKEDFFIISTLLVNKLATKFESIDFELMKGDLLKLHQAGIKILAGTDAPNLRINHGTDLFKELELLVEAGLTDIDALKAATSQPAKSFRLKNHGYIKKGGSADFVLINGDPTKNISDLKKILFIWKKGQPITPYNNVYKK